MKKKQTLEKPLQLLILFIMVGIGSFIAWVLATKYLCTATVQTAGADLCYDKPNQLQVFLLALSMVSFLSFFVVLVLYFVGKVLRQTKRPKK